MTLDVLKAAALLLVVAIAQLTIFNPLQLVDGSLDVLLCVLVAIALLRGAAFGALAGFWAGLVVDTASLGTLGLTSLLLILVGYGAGWFGTATSVRSSQVSRVSIAVAGATVMLFVGSALVTVFLGISITFGSSLVRSMLPSLALNLVFAYPIFLVVRLIFPVSRPSAREVIAAAS
jgi:rod shape-determining protein MreD